MMIAPDRSDEFWASWKAFRARNPVGENLATAAAPGPVSVLTLQADSDDEAMLQAGGGGGGGGGALSDEDDGAAYGSAATAADATTAESGGPAGGRSAGSGGRAAPAWAAPAPSRGDNDD